MYRALAGACLLGAGCSTVCDIGASNGSGVNVTVYGAREGVGGPVASGPLDYEVFREASPDGCHEEAVSASVVVHLEDEGGRLSLEEQ